MKKHPFKRYSIFGLTVVIMTAVFLFLMSRCIITTNAEETININTDISVRNTAPALTNGPSDGGSSAATPTNEGDNVVFTATATDVNNNPYYLIVCKTDSVTPNNTGAPSCDTDQQLCVSSSSVASDLGATCSFNTSGFTAESQDWYAFVCDENSGSLCSPSAQGTGDTGSPFKVNHSSSFGSVKIGPSCGLNAPIPPGNNAGLGGGGTPVPEWSAGGLPIDYQEPNLTNGNWGGRYSYGGALNVRNTPLLVPDGNGNYFDFVMLNDGTSNYWTAQKIDSSGARLWGDHGIRILDTQADGYGSRAVSDGNGGVYFVGNGTDATKITAFHIGSDGSMLYPADTYLATSGDCTQNFSTIYFSGRDNLAPSIISDGAGGFIAVWSSIADIFTSNLSVCAQRMASDGSRVWGDTAVLISSGSDHPMITEDGNHGALIAWKSPAGDVIVSHLNAADGSIVSPCDAGGTDIAVGLPNFISSDGAGGAVVTYNENGFPGALKAKRFDATCTLNSNWPTEGVQVIDAGGRIVEGSVLSGNSILFSTGEFDYPWPTTYANLLNLSDGSSVWGGNKFIWGNPAYGISFFAFPFASGSDFIFVSTTSTDGLAISKLLGSDGSHDPAFGDGGISLSNQGADLIGEASDGNGGLTLVYHKQGFYIQRVNSDGAAQWPDKNPVITDNLVWTSYSSGILASKSENGYSIVSWLRNVDSAQEFFAQIFDPSGNRIGPENGIQLTNNGFGKGSVLSIVSDDSGFYVIYSLYKGFAGDDYVQKIDYSGNILWQANGVPVANAFDGRIQSISDGNHGLFIVTDLDAGPTVLQHLDANGNRLFGDNGAVISSDQSYHWIASDGAGGFYITFTKNDSGRNKIFVKRFDSTGTLLPSFAPNGIEVGTGVMANKTVYYALTDNTGNLTIISEENNGTDNDFYEYKMSPTGEQIFGTGGAPIVAASGEQNVNTDVSQNRQFVVPDGNGGFFISWTDNRNGTNDFYGQHMDANGRPLWGSSAETTLTSDLAGGEDTIPVTSTADFSSIGAIKIGSAYVRYTGKTDTSFTGCAGTPVASSTARVSQNNGILLVYNGGSYPSLIDKNDDGGIVTAYISPSDSRVLDFQAFDANGAPEYSEPYALTNADMSSLDYPYATVNTGNSITIFWSKLLSDRDEGIYGQKLTIPSSSATAIPAGALDPTFGASGIVTTTGLSRVQSTAIQSDGKIVAAGVIYTSESFSTFGFTRYNTDGSLDTGFGTNGIVATDFYSFNGVSSVAIQSDGKIVAGGKFNDEFGLVRLNADGSPDTGFGTNGVVTTAIGSFGFSAIGSVAIQSDGKIVAGGNEYETYDHSLFTLARYNTDGSLDTGFGTNGIATTDIGGVSYIYSLAIQSDGKIVTSGNNTLARYNTDGSLDTGFGTNGIVTAAINGGSIVIQSDGKIVMAGQSSSGYALALARYNTDGSLDTGFGTGGIVTTNIGQSSSANSVAIQSDGKIVTAGFVSYVDFTSNFALARYNTDGSLDTGFGTNGITTTNIGGGDSPQSYAQSVSIQNDGRIVAAGTDYNMPFALARYMGALTTITYPDSICVQTTVTDTDTDTTTNTIDMYVCDTDSFVNGQCGGTTLCSVIGAPSGSAAHCIASHQVPVPTAHGQYPVYVFIKDNHGLLGAGTPENNYTVADVPPQLVSYSATDSPAPPAGGSDTVDYSVLLKDNNGDRDVSNVKGVFFYPSAVGHSCPANENNCYISSSCTLTGVSDPGSTDKTSLGTDQNLGADCSATVWYNALPGDWTVEAAATDGNGETAFANAVPSLTNNPLLGIDIAEPSISYGTLAIGGTSAEKPTTMENKGNQVIDVYIEGSQMCSPSSQSCDHNIPALQQKWSASQSFDWDTAGNTLVETPSGDAASTGCYDANIGVRTDHTSDSTDKPVFWKLKLPVGTLAGRYTGENTFTSTADGTCTTPPSYDVSQTGDEEGSISLSCTNGGTISSFSSKWGVGCGTCGGGAGVDCGSCTIGSSSCDVSYGAGQCGGDCNYGCFKPSSLTITCSQ